MAQGGKLALTLLWSVGLWLLVFLLLFLLLPILSALPLSWGAFCALGAFLCQFIGGVKLLRLLLGLKKADANGIYFIPGSCPFVFLLDNQLVATEACRHLLIEKNHFESILRSSWGKFYNNIYSNLLAFPSLLRAFESFTSDYGRLHFSQGPLWHLGRGFGWLASLLESPLRWGRPELNILEPSDKEIIRQQLSIPLGRAVRVPAWMADLDILSPIDFLEAKREAAWFWAGQEGQPPISVKPWVGLWFPWSLFLFMSLWAIFAQGLWGAPVLFLGLGYIVKINSEYAPASSDNFPQILETDWKGKYLPIVVEGVARRQNTPGLDDTWLDFAKTKQDSQENSPEVEEAEPNEVAEDIVTSQTLLPRTLIRLESFVGWQAAEGAYVKCEGWLNSCSLAICVSRLLVKDKKYNYYPRLWRLLLPWFLVGAGLVWSILQKVGL